MSSIVRKDKRGGVSTYVCDCLSHTVVDEFSVMNPSIECLAVCVRNMCTAVIYRALTGSKLEFIIFLESLLVCFGFAGSPHNYG